MLTETRFTLASKLMKKRKKLQGFSLLQLQLQVETQSGDSLEENPVGSSVMRSSEQVVRSDVMTNDHRISDLNTNEALEFILNDEGTTDFLWRNDPVGMNVNIESDGDPINYVIMDAESPDNVMGSDQEIFEDIEMWAQQAIRVLLWIRDARSMSDQERSHNPRDVQELYVDVITDDHEPFDVIRDDQRMSDVNNRAFDDEVIRVSLIGDAEIQEIETALGLIFPGSQYHEEEAEVWEQILGAAHQGKKDASHILHG